MDLSSYITALLSDNDTVIIPGFGAFISVYKPAVIRENEIIPPGKEIRFFQQIRNNDNLLAMQIARAKKISFDDAFKRIERATSKIILQLDKGEKVVFGDLGEFIYNETGEIQFIQYHTDSPITAAGFKPVSLEDVIEEPEVIIGTTEPEKEPEVTAEPTVETATVDALQEEELPIEKTEEHKVVIESTETSGTELTETVELPTPGKINPVKTDKKKNRTGVWLLLLLLVIIFIAVFLFFRKEKPVSGEPESQIQNTNTETIQSTSAVTESIQPADTAKTEIQQTNIAEVSKFYLVGGGFKSEENAAKFIEQLKEKGIDGIMLGKKGSIYLVGIASFNNSEDAFRELNKRMRENPDWKLWVYQK